MHSMSQILIRGVNPYVRCSQRAWGNVNYIFFFYKMLTKTGNAITKLILEQINFYLQLLKDERILVR